MQVTVARVSGAGCHVLAHAWDRTVGCAGLDRALYTYLTTSLSPLPGAGARDAKAGEERKGGLFGLVGRGRGQQRGREKGEEEKGEGKGRGGAGGVLAGAELNPRARWVVCYVVLCLVK